jgi:uncharacterized protein YxeA
VKGYGILAIIFAILLAVIAAGLLVYVATIDRSTL